MELLNTARSRREGRAGVAAVVRLSTADRICLELRNRILDGQLAPGTRLLELKVASELGISQGTVREAFSKLESQSLVEREVYGGTRVRSADSREMEEAIVLRAELERLAISLGADGLMRRFRMLRGLAERSSRAAARSDRRRYQSHDHTFHYGLVSAAGNRMLLRCWQNTQFEFSTAVRTRTPHLELSEVQHTNGRILDAIERGHLESAGHLVAADVRSAWSAHPALTSLTRKTEQ
jgi:DNA-binding GntR family transcriptional regulator